LAQLLVRNLDDDVKARLRVMAAEHGRSIEEGVRAILREAVEDRPRLPGLGTRAAARFAHSGCTTMISCPILGAFKQKA
jgi:plasmid stability protein